MLYMYVVYINKIRHQSTNHKCVWNSTNNNSISNAIGCLLIGRNKHTPNHTIAGHIDNRQQQREYKTIHNGGGGDGRNCNVASRQNIYEKPDDMQRVVDKHPPTTIIITSKCAQHPRMASTKHWHTWPGTISVMLNMWGGGLSSSSSLLMLSKSNNFFLFFSACALFCPKMERTSQPAIQSIHSFIPPPHCPSTSIFHSPQFHPWQRRGRMN